MSKVNNWQDQHLSEVTEIMRQADLMFVKVGGSTRHYLRDVFLPMLEDKGYEIKKSDELCNLKNLVLLQNYDGDYLVWKKAEYENYVLFVGEKSKYRHKLIATFNANESSTEKDQEIDKLKAENERMRLALKEMLNHASYPTWLKDQATEALK